jgi:hypothetical protein
MEGESEEEGRNEGCKDEAEMRRKVNREDATRREGKRGR